jgi:hypothetical protein
MWYSAAGSIVTLILSMLAVPLGAAAQPAGKVWRLGILVAWQSSIDRLSPVGSPSRNGLWCVEKENPHGQISGHSHG